MAHSWLDADGIIRRLSELRTEDVGGGTTSNLPYHLQLEREHEGEAGLDAPPGFSEMIRANIGDLTPPEMRDFLQGARALLVQHTGELPANHCITRELAQMDHQLVEAEHRGRPQLLRGERAHLRVRVTVTVMYRVRARKG